MFLWGNLPQLIPNKLILSIAYILGGTVGQGPRPQPLVLCHCGWQRSPMGSSVLGVGLCSATDWGGALQQLSPFSACQGRPSLYSGQGGQGLPLLYIQWAEPGGGWAGGPAVIAQGAADREGHPQGSSICPEPLGPLARQSSRLGILPGPREQELCLCRGWAARPAPASWPRPSDGQFSAPGPPLAHRPAHSRLAQRCPS